MSVGKASTSRDQDGTVKFWPAKKVRNVVYITLGQHAYVFQTANLFTEKQYQSNKLAETKLLGKI